VLAFVVLIDQVGAVAAEAVVTVTAAGVLAAVRADLVVQLVVEGDVRFGVLGGRELAGTGAAAGADAGRGAHR